MSEYDISLPIEGQENEAVTLPELENENNKQEEHLPQKLPGMYPTIDGTQTELQETESDPLRPEFIPENNIPIASKDIKTEADALKFLKAEIARRFRLLRFDNMIDRNFDIELEDAIYDCLSEINSTPPLSSFGLLDFVPHAPHLQDTTKPHKKQSKSHHTDHRYWLCLVFGSARNAITALYSEWTANGMNVGIEDLSIDNKTSDTQALMQYCEERFNKYLEILKAEDIRFAKFRTFRTLPRRGGGMFSRKICQITSRGGRL